MIHAFDTLGYAKRLRDAGVEAEKAEAHAEAARDFIMSEVATKSDLQLTWRVLEIIVQNSELRLENRIDALEGRLEGLELRLLVRLGGPIAIGIAVLAAIIKF